MTILPCDLRMPGPKSACRNPRGCRPGIRTRLVSRATGFPEVEERRATDCMQRIAFDFAQSYPASVRRRLSLALPFAHEDVAIVFGAYILANHLMQSGVVIAVIAGGLLLSDLVLYGIGAGARHLAWLQRHTIDERVRGLGEAFRRDLFSLIALCRFVPNLVFVADIACGWARVSLARFTAATICVSASYVVMMLYLVTIFGDALDDHIGLWTWPLLFALLATSAFARQRILAFRGTTAAWRGEPIRLG